jgi:hypothetical protein
MDSADGRMFLRTNGNAERIFVPSPRVRGEGQGEG